MDKIAILERLLEIAKEEKELLGELMGIAPPTQKNQTQKKDDLANYLKEWQERQLDEIAKEQARKNLEGQKNPNFPPPKEYYPQFYNELDPSQNNLSRPLGLLKRELQE